MTNEEAFKDWLKFISVELTGMDLKIAEAAWQSAIAYMQEQSEPVAEAIRERDRLGFAVVNVIGKLDEIIENTQEVEIDDFLHIAISIDMWNELQAALEDMPKRADLYTTPQRQQPLKRLSQLDVLKILNECAKSPYTNTQSSLGFANAIMNAMQEINK